jgi:undecaprenyl diphosphate synthase
MEKNKGPVRHVAIIMDGNGRWAERHGLQRIEGHREGAEAVKKAVETAQEIGLEYLTLYAFSTENWNRSKDEVDGLMHLLEEFLDTQLATINEKGVRLKTIGRTWELPESVRKKLLKAVEETSNNTGGTLVLALNYGGRAEIADAAKKIALDAIDKKLDPDKIDESVFADYLYDPELPDPDLMIRTSGELRLSNFLLWQLSYSEFYITDVLWPDFNRDEFLKAVDSLGDRDRRFGGR